MARLARAMPHRPIITGFVPPPPPPAPVIPAPNIIRSAARENIKLYQRLPKRAILPVYNTPPSSPYIFHSVKLDTERRYRTLPKRAIIPRFVEPVKPTTIIRSTAKEAAIRAAAPRRKILPLPFVTPPAPIIPPANTIHSIRITQAISQAGKRKPIFPQPFVVTPIPVVPQRNIIHSPRIEIAKALAKPHKPILPLPFVVAVPYIAPVSTFIVHSYAREAARRAAGKTKRGFITAPFTPPIGSTAHEQPQFYWGRLARGQYMNIILNIDQLPDAVPTVTLWQNGTTAIETLEMPRVRAASKVFRLTKMLDASYDDGNYAAVMRFEIDGGIFCSVGYFEVSGGIGTAPNITITEIDRSLGRAVVTQDADGFIKMGYKPRKSLP